MSQSKRTLFKGVSADWDKRYFPQGVSADWDMIGIGMAYESYSNPQILLI